MKTPTKPVFLLLGFVLVIYVMRHNDLSISKGLRGSVTRILSSGTRPSQRLCAGISLEESFSSGDISRAKGFMDNLKSQRGGNPLEDLIANSGGKFSSDDAKDYGMPLLKYLVPWAVFFVLSFLLCIGFYLNWCCMFGICKNVKICKCCKVPKEPKRIKLCMGITGFFLVGMLGASIAGTIFSTKISKGMEVTFCSALGMVENLVYGKPEEKWIGLKGVVSSIEDIKSQFLGIIDNVDQISDPSSLSGSYGDTVTAIDALYSNLQNREIPEPNNLNDAKNYKIEYIQNLGPKGDQNTYTYFLQEELNGWRDTIVGAQDLINDAVGDLQGQKNSIDSSLTSGISTANDIVGDVESVINDLEDSGQTVKDIFKGAGYGVMGIFIANLVLALFAIASMIMVGLLKVKFFNKLLHLNWCIVIILTIFCWILSTFFLPASVVMLEACGVLDRGINDQTFFTNVMNQVFSEDASQAKDIALTCMHGDGYALETLGLNESLGYFQTIYDEIDKVNEYIPIDGGYSAGNPPPSVSITLQQELLQAIYDGLIPDSQTTVAQLTTFNGFVDSSCSQSNDRWYLNSQNCSNNGAVFQLSSSNDFDIPRETCIGLDMWNGRAGSSRYTSAVYPDGCNNVNTDYIQKYVDGFVQHRNNLRNLIKDGGASSIESYMNEIYDKHRIFAAQIMTFVGQVKDVKDDLMGLEDALIGPQNGVIANTNCRFIKTDLNTLQQAMCIGFVATLYQTAIVMIVTSFMAFFSTIFVFCLAKKFSAPENQNGKEGKVNPNYLS